MLYRAPSRELLTIKKDLGKYIVALETERPFSQDFINTFKKRFKHFSINILSITENYALFEHAIKLENMIGAMFYQVDQERRRYPRFPLTADLILNTNDQTHKLFAHDISSVGISFLSPVALVLGRRYQCTRRARTGDVFAAGNRRAGSAAPSPQTLSERRPTKSRLEQVEMRA